MSNKVLSTSNIAIPDPEDDLGSIWASPSFWVALIPILSGALTTFFGDDFGIKGNAQALGSAAASIAAAALVISRSISRKALVEARTRRLDLAAGLALRAQDTNDIDVLRSQVRSLHREFQEKILPTLGKTQQTGMEYNLVGAEVTKVEEPVKSVRTRAPRKAVDPNKVDMRTKEGRALKAQQDAAAAKRVAKRPARA